MSKVSTYVGLDVHSERIVIATLIGQAREPTILDIPNDPKVIRRTFKRLAAEAYELRCCYEAGPCGFELFRQLTSMGLACEVIAPSLIPVKSGDRIKTDRRDASKLARLYRAGELTTITVPTSDQEAVRDLVRAREDVRKDLTAARHRLGKFLIRHGRIFSEGHNWTDRARMRAAHLRALRPRGAAPAAAPRRPRSRDRARGQDRAVFRRRRQARQPARHLDPLGHGAPRRD